MMTSTPAGPHGPWKDNPYGADLGGRDVMAALAGTPDLLRAIAEKMTPKRCATSYAEGKWTAGQLFQHLAHTELAFGYRIRMAITTNNYVVQPFDQDGWVARDPSGGVDAFRAYYAMRQWNLPMFRSLSDDDRHRPFRHPERGEMTVQWILEMLAGHELHHLQHFEAIARQ
jgi:hypothetical protein